MRIRGVILFVLCLMYFVAYVDRVNISVAGPTMRQELGLTPTELGFIFSAFAYPYAAMQIAGGWAADRFGPRRVLAILSLLWAAATMLTGLAWSVASLVWFRLLVGVGEGGAFPTATRALTCWLPVRERAFAQGITHSFARLGGAVTPPIVLAIVARYGWREAFYVLGAVSLAWTAVWLVSFRDSPEQHPWVTGEELAVIHAGGGARRAARGPTPWRQIASRMWLVTLVDFCYGWSLWVFLTWLPSYLSDARGFKLREMAVMTTLPLLAGVVGDTLGGVISDAIFRRTGNLRLARRALLVVGLARRVRLSASGDRHRQRRRRRLIAGGGVLLSRADQRRAVDAADRHRRRVRGHRRRDDEHRLRRRRDDFAGRVRHAHPAHRAVRTAVLTISAVLLLVGALCSLAIDPTARVEDVQVVDSGIQV